MAEFRDRLEWADIWMAMLAVLVLFLASTIGYALFQDHSVQFYYISDHGINGGRNGYCIDGYRYWWANDTGVFCSDDVEKSITVLKQLNDGMTHKK